MLAKPQDPDVPLPSADTLVDPKLVGRFRWVICWLLFAATVFNYIDRQMIGVLKPTLQHELGWSETAYANWTIGHMSHALARTAFQFTLARMVLGVGEGGSFPGALKAVSDWFPNRERAFAIGLLNAGSNIGAIVTPLIVPAIALTIGWRWAFIITGLASMLWLAAWLMIYRTPRRHPKVSAAEVAYIESDPPEKSTPVPWLRLLTVRETWAYALGKFLIDPIWWMFLFWLPDFFAKRHHLDLISFGPPLIVVYVVSDLGSLSGGWFSSMLLKRGWSLNAARKTAMLVAAIAVLPVSVIFIIAACTYLLALAAVHILSPRYAPAKLDAATA
jgi:ACS family hexuronate transporter-like MFS transporter